MIAGEKKYKNGYQVSLFPLDYINCIQKPQVPSYSHCCGTATDYIGTTTHYPFYAPFDCHEIQTYASDTKAYLSDKPVLTPNGVMRLCVGFTHDENPPTQTIFKQGDLIGHTGNAGFSTRDHLHLDQSVNGEYYLIQSGIICDSGNECWELLGGILPNEAYYLSGNETIIDTLGINYQTIQGGTSYPLTNEIIGAITRLKKKNKNGRIILR